MRTALIFAVLMLVAVGIGGMAARLTAKAPDSAAIVQPTTVQADTPARVVLPAGHGGHFMLTGIVNGKGANFVVDTGATIVALTYRDAERLGLGVKPADFTKPMSTANGVIKAAPVRIPSITIGAVTATNIEGAVLPDGALGINLLGMSFLMKMKRYEFSQGKLILEK